MANALYRKRQDWNRRGPHVPLWFRRRLKQLDPKMVLQFMPPRSHRDPRGVPSQTFPNGVWDICRRLPKSGLLHPVAVWSLTDKFGNYAVPGTDTLRLLRRAMYYHRQGQMHKLEILLENAFQEIHDAKVRKSRDDLVNAMRRFLNIRGSRQWQNRVYLRREPPHKAKRDSAQQPGVAA